jgi:hypothetical protein
LDGNHLLVLASDHGMTRIDRHTDVATAMEKRGLRVLRHPILWRRNPHISVMVSGNASAQVYLQPGAPRSYRWSVAEIKAGLVPGIPDDLVEWIAGLEGVALVAGVDGPDVIVESDSGHARLTDLGDGQIRYDPVTADVLELCPYPTIRHEREWLATSIDSRFPDAPAQLLQLFQSTRAGDLVITASENADLRQEWEFPEHRSGHGGLIRAHMKCVIAANRRLATPMRTVDLFPLIVDHLGYELPKGIDGKLTEGWDWSEALVVDGAHEALVQ